MPAGECVAGAAPSPNCAGKSGWTKRIYAGAPGDGSTGRPAAGAEKAQGAGEGFRIAEPARLGDGRKVRAVAAHQPPPGHAGLDFALKLDPVGAERLGPRGERGELTA